MRVIVSFVGCHRVVNCRNSEDLWSCAWRVYRWRQVSDTLDDFAYVFSI